MLVEGINVESRAVARGLVYENLSGGCVVSLLVLAGGHQEMCFPGTRVTKKNDVGLGQIITKTLGGLWRSYPAVFLSEISYSPVKRPVCKLGPFSTHFA